MSSQAASSINEHVGGKDEGRAPPQECSECGAVATTELEGDDGKMYPLCANCDVWWRETQAELADQAEALQGQQCQDCHREPATCRFLHMYKGEFFLCEGCWGWADHEDDYLERCDHAFPEGEPGQTNCDLCRRPLPPADAYCTCTTPVTRDFERINCRSCCGRIRYGREPEVQDFLVAGDDEEDGPKYDWGQEEDGDFVAEADAESDGGDYEDEDIFAQTIRDMVLDGTYALLSRV